MNEDRATRYHRLRRRAVCIAGLLTATLLVGLLVTGGAIRLRDASLRAVGLLAAPIERHELLLPGSAGRRWVEVAVFAASLGLLHGALVLPVSWYGGFWLQRRYGLSTQPWAGWMRDRLRAFGLGGLPAVAGAGVVYQLLDVWPGYWWVGASLLFGVALVGLTYLTPLVILPLFSPFQPLSRPSLSERLVRLAERARTPVLGAFEWQLGSKTRQANAALVGVWGSRRILLSDTLLGAYSDEEIEVVLAHELGHHVHGDIWKALALEVGLMAAALAVADVALERLGPAAGLRGRADLAGLPLIVSSVQAVSWAALPLMNAVSRRHERRADEYALRLTGRPEAFVAAVRRLGAQNLAEANPSRLVELLCHTHPPLASRVAFARTGAWPGQRTSSSPRIAEQRSSSVRLQ